MAHELKGIVPVIASPCDEIDTLLEDKFAELVAKLCMQGSRGLYVCGATGDGYNMPPQERKRATEIAIELSRE